MHQVPSLVPLLLLVAALVPAAYCLHMSTSSDSDTSRHRQHHWPRRTVVERSGHNNDEIDSTRLRQALQQLLELNDGELQALMSGMSHRKVAPRIEPSTAFLLASSRQYLERLNTILSTVEETSLVKKSTWNPRIARRHKKARQSHRNSFGVQPKTTHQIAEDDDPDSILGALTALSEYLSGAEDNGREERTQQERKRRSHHQGRRGHKHQTLERHDSTQVETHHYLYYLRSGECPLSSDGIPKMFCPTPSDTGEWKCIEDHELCDSRPQCPNEEDEAPTHCLFHNAMKTHIDELTKYILLSKLS